MIQSHSALLHPPPWGCTGGVPAWTDPGLSRCLGARQTSPKLGDAAVLGLLEPPRLVVFRGSARHGGAPGLVPELTGRMGAIAGLGTQTVLNASGSESVAKGCRLLASESPRQGYVKAQRVTLSRDHLPAGPLALLQAQQHADKCLQKVLGAVGCKGTFSPGCDCQQRLGCGAAP